MKNLNKMQVKYISNENILIVTTTSTLAPSPIPSPLFSTISLSLCYVCKFISMLSAHFNGIKITHTNFP